MDSDVKRLPPGDPKLVKSVMSHLKSQGIFDEFRRDCIADVDTKPAYQNLRHRVESFANEFLQNTQWRPELNKNQQREMLRRKINDSGMLTTGVDRIIDQIVNQKLYQVFLPKITEIVHQFLGIEKDKNDFNVKSELVTSSETNRQRSADNSINDDEDTSATSSLWHLVRPGTAGDAITSGGMHFVRPDVAREATSSDDRKPSALSLLTREVPATRDVGEDDDDSSDIMSRISKVLQECTTTAVAAKGQGNFAAVAKDTNSPTTVSQDSEEQNSNKSMSSLSSASSARVSETAIKEEKTKQAGVAKSKLPGDNTKDFPGKSPDKKPFKFDPHATRSFSGSSSPRKTSKPEPAQSRTSGSASPRRKSEQHPVRSSSESCSPKGPSRGEIYSTKSSGSPKVSSKLESHATRSSGSSSPKVTTKLASGSSSPRGPSKTESTSTKSSAPVSPGNKTDQKGSKAPSSNKDPKSKDPPQKTAKSPITKSPVAIRKHSTLPDSSSSDSSSSSSRCSARIKETGNIKPAKLRDESFVLEPEMSVRRGGDGGSTKGKTLEKVHSSAKVRSGPPPSKRSKLPSTSSDGAPSKGGTTTTKSRTSTSRNSESVTHKSRRPVMKSSKADRPTRREGSKSTSGHSSDSRSSEAESSISRTAKDSKFSEINTPVTKLARNVSPKRSPSRERESTTSSHVRDEPRKRSRLPSTDDSLDSPSPKQSRMQILPDSLSSHPASGERSSEMSPHRRGARRRLSESSPVKPRPEHGHHLSEDDLDEGEMSDVTVSSVHTSDLSDFDDRIVLSDGEADDAEETGPASVSPPPSPFASGYTGGRVTSATIKREPADDMIDVDEGKGQSVAVKSEPFTREKKQDKECVSATDHKSTKHTVKQERKVVEPKPGKPAPEITPPEEKSAKKSSRQQQLSAPPPPPAQDADVEPRRGSRRQRKLNPRYTSDDFSSIFNSSATWDRPSLPPPPPSGGDGGHAAASPVAAEATSPAVQQSPSTDSVAPVRGRRLTGHSNTTDEIDLPPGSPISDASEFSVETASRSSRRVSTRNKMWSPVGSSDGDHSSARGAHTPGSVTSDGQESHQDFRPRTSSQHSGGSGFGQKRDRSRSSGGESSLVSLVDETAHCSSRVDDGPSTHRRRTGSSARRNDTQRYDSSDLYKPRPSFSSSRRRALSPSKSLEPRAGSSRRSDDNPASSPSGKPRAPSTGSNRHLDVYPAAAAEPSRWARKLVFGVSSELPAPLSRSQRSSTDSFYFPSAARGPMVEPNLSRLRRRSIKLVY